MLPEVNEEDVLSLMALTGMDRSDVETSLVVCNGNTNLAYQMLNKTPTKPADRKGTEDESSGSNSQKKPLVMVTNCLSEWSQRKFTTKEEGDSQPARNMKEATEIGEVIERNEKRKRKNYDSEYLTLKVIRPFLECGQSEIHFKVKHTTPLGKLKKSYSDRIDVPLYLLRFLYNGRRILDEDTPGTLEMESDEFVEVYDELPNTHNINGANCGPNQHKLHDDKSLATASTPTLTATTSAASIAATTSSSAPVLSTYTQSATASASRLDFAVGGEKRRSADLSIQLRSDQLPSVELEQCGYADDLLDRKMKIARTERMKSTGSGEAPQHLDGSEHQNQQDDDDGEADREQGNKDNTTEEMSELLRITQKYNNLVRVLRDKVECPVCLDIPKRAPIPLCTNGHVVCSNCARRECPTCRAPMDTNARGVFRSSTLAVTIIENIDHVCEWEDCAESFPLNQLARHVRECAHRLVVCPGLDCAEKFSVASLLEHTLYCSVEKNVIIQYSLPHKFTYLTKSDVPSIMENNRDLNWKMEGIKYDDKIFFLKVSCVRSLGKAPWCFMMQMLGGEEGCSKYAVNIIVFNGSVKGKYSKTYSGDVCQIDVSSNAEAYDKDLCLTLTDRGMEKILMQNTSGNYEFSVLVNITKC